jgi:hypothetical protein
MCRYSRFLKDLLKAQTKRKPWTWLKVKSAKDIPFPA